MAGMNIENQATLLDIPLEDVVIPKIVKYLKLRDVLNLRAVSRDFRELGNSILQLTFRTFDFLNEGPNSAETFDVLGKNCNRLKAVKLKNMPWLTDAALTEVFERNAPTLEHVTLEMCDQITFLALHTLCLRAKNLTSLRIPKIKCRDGLLQMISLHNSHLTEVDFSACLKISSQGLQDFFKSQPRLRTIILCEMQVELNPVISAIAQNCRELKMLDIYKNPNVEDSPLLELATNCPELKEIFLSYEVNLQSTTLNRLKAKGINVKYESNKQPKICHMFPRSPRMPRMLGRKERLSLKYRFLHDFDDFNM